MSTVVILRFVSLLGYHYDDDDDDDVDVIDVIYENNNKDYDNIYISHIFFFFFYIYIEINTNNINIHYVITIFTILLINICTCNKYDFTKSYDVFNSQLRILQNLKEELENRYKMAVKELRRKLQDQRTKDLDKQKVDLLHKHLAEITKVTIINLSAEY